MDWVKFQTRVPGKWVLAGEHSVLRGAAAVALPHPELGLTLSFDPRQKETSLLVHPAEANAILLELLGSMTEDFNTFGRESRSEALRDFVATVVDSPEPRGAGFSYPSGCVEIDSTIPVGAGLGSSAALCVAVTRWVSSFLMLNADQEVALATRLEHRFHGKSSGMDVAVISAGQPIVYTMAGGVRAVQVKHLPKFTFHDTGLRSRTRDCVERVEKFRDENPLLGARVDERMGLAAQSAIEGLAAFDRGDRGRGLKLLVEGIGQARECFYSWELVPGEARRLEESLLRDGAIAVKMTGAGGGGMVVALWER